MANTSKASWRPLAVLWVLYIVQGLPYGFQLTALPVFLRAAGISRTGIGFLSMLALPWMLKVLWAPLVDGYSSARLGRRRSWILPLQLALAAACLGAMAFPPQGGLAPLLALVFVMNLLAATMDIAVDGLAIDTLAAEDLGKGNVAQVVGFKVGMLTGGGLLVWLSGWIGWAGQFGAMAALVMAAFAVTWWSRPAPDAAHQVAVPASLRQVFAKMKRALALPGAMWLLLIVATYKFGETLVDTMFKPFLIDAGFSVEQIGLWAGTWGMLFSLAGSFAGGWAATRMTFLTAVAVTASLRVIPLAGEWWLAFVDPTAKQVVTLICAENFFGGALTTAMFAFMMSRVERKIGATHFTLLASIEVWGKLPAGWLSGWLADQTSYAMVFGLGVLGSILFLALLPFGRRLGTVQWSSPPDAA